MGISGALEELSFLLLSGIHQYREDATVFSSEKHPVKKVPLTLAIGHPLVRNW